MWIFRSGDPCKTLCRQSASGGARLWESWRTVQLPVSISWCESRWSQWKWRGKSEVSNRWYPLPFDLVGRLNGTMALRMPSTEKQEISRTEVIEHPKRWVIYLSINKNIIQLTTNWSLECIYVINCSLHRVAQTCNSDFIQFRNEVFLCIRRANLLNYTQVKPSSVSHFHSCWFLEETNGLRLICDQLIIAHKQKHKLTSLFS